MSVSFTEPALRQLDAILDYIRSQSPLGATKVAGRIQEVLATAAEHPRMGRRTDRRGFRRLVIEPYPYVLLYRASRGGIVVHAVRHAARRRDW